VSDILSILRNAGLQNPLADLAAAPAPSLTAARHQPVTHQVAVGRSSDAQVNGAQSLGDSAVSGSADVADAGPVLAGDDGGTGAPDVSNNLLALLSQLAPAGQWYRKLQLMLWFCSVTGWLHAALTLCAIVVRQAQRWVYAWACVMLFKGASRCFLWFELYFHIEGRHGVFIAIKPITPFMYMSFILPIIDSAY